MDRSTTLGVALLLVLAGACDESAPEKTPRKQALESIANDVLEPMLAIAHDNAIALDESAGEFCESRARADLDAVRKRWGHTCEAWKRTEVMAFGPHTMPPYSFAADIDFWPAREDSIDRLLGSTSGDASADDDAGAEPGELPGTLGASQKGLPAIEYLLFGPRDATLAAFQDGARGDHRCAYLLEMTKALANDTAELQRVFHEEFAPDFTLTNNPNDRYSSVNEAFEELVNNMIFAVETVRGTRLAGPLGNTSGGEPQPEEVESRYSDQSVRAAVAVLDGVADVFFGNKPADKGATTFAIEAVLRERHLDLRAAYRAKHEAAVAALEAIPEPLRDAVVDDRAKVEAARTAITDLLMLLKVDIAQALSVTATFGRNDGDGD
jgi:predicted lipoprotein